MSREIKYRVWDENKGEYRTDYENMVLYPDGTFQIETSWCIISGEFVVEQYTGLKDKNGKEIYEGDIVRTTDNVTVKGLIFPIGVVEFKQRAFWICNAPSERPDFAHNETLLQYWETDLEVIGNIHENPELFGGEDETN